MDEVSHLDPENNSIALIDNPSSSQNINQAAAVDLCANENNLDTQLFDIIDKLKETVNFEGNANFQYFHMRFEELVNDSRVNINLTDDMGNTPLHYTVKYKWDRLTKLLLDHNAYIGVKNANKELPIDGISYNILSDFFDSRITSNDTHHSKNEARYEINLDYSFLIMKPDRRNKFSYNTNQFYPIQFISESEHLKQLIIHPLIHYLIWTKSETLAYLFIWNGIMFLLSLLSIIHITFFRIKPTTDASTTMFYFTITGTYICIFLNITMLVLKILDFRNGIDRFTVYLRREGISTLYNLGISATLFLILRLDEGDWRKSLTAACIILIAIDMNQLLTTFPKFQKMSVHFIMLKKITFRFIKVLLFYLILLCAFSLSFYVLSGSTQKDFANIRELNELFVRVIGMMVGELNLNFDGHLPVYYVIMLIFIFMITIVLINLLNGLAITDVGEIRHRAKLIYLVYRLQLIASCNNFFTNNIRLRYLIFRLSRCLACSSCRFGFQVDVALCRYVKEIKIQPNRNLSTLTNILRPAEMVSNSNVDIIEWNKINKNILNKLLVKIETKFELENSIRKENESMNMLVQINQKLDVLLARQINTG